MWINYISCWFLFCSKTVLFNLNVLTISCARSRNHLSAKASVHVHLVTSFRQVSGQVLCQTAALLYGEML